MDKLFSLEGKTAVITGGSGILGRGFCKVLAEYGANVAIVDLKQSDVDRVASDISGSVQENKLLPIQCDITDPKSLKKMLAQIIEKFGKINILHNNAGSKSENHRDFFEKFEDYDYKVWQDIMRVNIDGMFLTTQLVGKHMVDHGQGGSIINTASIYGVVAPDQSIYKGSEYLGVEINTPAVYSTSKAAVIGFSKYLATYWAHDNIRVNILTPGGIESGQNETFKKNYSSRVPLGRMGMANELHGALLFLASDAASYVTGQNIIVDGGLTCW
jgi:NAD(P)-dependent dehydrogenase (short-subunit alcohol dehydrogenase family)